MTDLATCPVCPVCQDPLASGPVWRCEACATPHHAACRAYVEGCSTYGCVGRATPPPRGWRFWTRAHHVDERDAPYNWAILVAITLFTCTLLSTPAGPVTPVLVGLVCFMVALLTAGMSAEGLMLEVDEGAGTLRRLTQYPLGVSRDRLVRLERLAELRPRVRVLLVEEPHRPTFVALELVGTGAVLRPRLAACPVSDWPELRAVARTLATALKTDLEVPPALAA